MGCVVQIQKGLREIGALDQVMQEKLAEQIMVDKETFPEKWAIREQMRLDKRANQVEAMLKKEHKKRKRR